MNFFSNIQEKNKIVITGALVIIVAAVAGGTVVFFAQEPTDSLVPEDAVQPSVNWIDYRNEKYRFEVKIPEHNTCTLKEISDSSFSYGRIQIDVFDAQRKKLQPFVDDLVDMRSRVLSGASFPVWIVESRTNTEVNEEQAIKIAYRFGGTNRFGEAVFLSRAGNIYQVGFTAGAFSCDETTIFPQLLSTFKPIPRVMEKAIWKEYILETITDDSSSPLFMDRMLVGFREDGTRDVIAQSVREVMGWEKFPGEAGYYPVKVSFPLFSKNIYFVQYGAGSGHSSGLFELNVETLKYQELSEIGSVYENYLNTASRISPDGFQIATIGNDEEGRAILYLSDLRYDSVTELVVAEEGERFFIAAKEPEFQWVNDNTIRYPVYPADSFERIEFREAFVE